jgi:hexosaminidase
MRTAIAALMLIAGLAGAQDLMPLPASMTAGHGALAIDTGFQITLTGYQEPRLRAAAARVVARIARQTGLPLARAFEPDSSAAETATLVLDTRGPGAEVQTPAADESYTLEITPQQARIRAAEPTGILRGLETFLQLIRPGEKGFEVPAIRIEDRPRFAWRGLLIDSSRHFMPIAVIRRNLDGMAAVKLNVLHWHLSDDQGFRVESKLFPLLQRMGSDGRFYTQDQIREIVRYARERGIRVVPEFDIPGHSAAMLTAYPDLAAGPGPFQIVRTWGVHDPTLDPTREEVYDFLDRFIGEMAGLFPDPYFHIGGDEVNGKQWNANPAIQEFKRAHNMTTNADLQLYFTRRVEELVRKHGKKMIGWDEILSEGMPKDVVVQSWRGAKSLVEAARQGNPVILSSGYYIDLVQPASQHYAVDPLNGPAAELTPEEQARILGGEACMWAEYVNAETVDSRIWPRTAAIAERLWSPRTVTDTGSMYRRMEAVSRELDWLGLEHRRGYVPMLERIAGSAPLDAVRTLADVVEPVKGYARNRARKYTSLTPLNRMVDAARPESDTAREFANLVDRGLGGDKAAMERVREQLAVWRGNDARLAPAYGGSFLLAEVAPVSQDISALGAAGLEALDYIAARKHAPRQWLERQEALIGRVKQPRAELLIMIAAPIEKLLNAAK